MKYTNNNRINFSALNSDQVWSHALELLDSPVYLIDLDDRVVRANSAFYRLLNREPAEVLGFKVTDFFHPNGETEACAVCKARYELYDADVMKYASDPDNLTNKDLKIKVRIVYDAEARPVGVLQSMEDVTEIQRQIERYHKKNNELEALLEDAKKQFNTLYHLIHDTEQNTENKCSELVSHELRTPLNVIIGYSELLLEIHTKTLTQQERKDLEAIRTAGITLCHKIESILE